MKNIFLVFTRHKECGYANASSLLEFLERYQPEVIFLELPRYAFNWYYGLFFTRTNLESTAVRQYRDKNPTVSLEPVDIPVPEDFERDKEELFETIAAVSPEFRKLLDENTRDECEKGLPYLNSDDCSQRWKEIYAVAKATLETLSVPALTTRFSVWTSTHERRDQAMMYNIRQYCRDHVFERGVLLVGAAHRQPIIDKAKAPAVSESEDIAWQWQE